MKEFSRLPQRILVDFDSTVAYPIWDKRDGKWRIGDTVLGAEQALEQISQDHKAEIVIYTSRPEGQERDDVRRWLKQHKLPYEIEPTRKPRGMAIIDDLAVGFRGNWQDARRGVSDVVRNSEIERKILLGGTIYEDVRGDGEVEHSDWAGDKI